MQQIFVIASSSFLAISKGREGTPNLNNGGRGRGAAYQYSR
jgi:hypothetical protein